MEPYRWLSFRHGLLIIIILALVYMLQCSGSKISDLRLCADSECKTVISLAKTLARHQHNDPVFLTFSRGEVVQVLSKSAGNRPDLWAGQIGNKKGYFPRSFVREYKVEIPNPQQVVPTEVNTLKPPEDTDIEKDDTDLGDDDTEVTEDVKVEVEDEGYDTDTEVQEDKQTEQKKEGGLKDETKINEVDKPTPETSATDGGKTSGSDDTQTSKTDEGKTKDIPDGSDETELKDDDETEIMDETDVLDETELSDEKKDETELSDQKKDETELSDEKKDETELSDEKKDETDVSEEKKDATYVSDKKKDETEVSDEKRDETELTDEKKESGSSDNTEMSDKDENKVAASEQKSGENNEGKKEPENNEGKKEPEIIESVEGLVIKDEDIIPSKADEDMKFSRQGETDAEILDDDSKTSLESLIEETVKEFPQNTEINKELEKDVKTQKDQEQELNLREKAQETQHIPDNTQENEQGENSRILEAQGKVEDQKIEIKQTDTQELSQNKELKPSPVLETPQTSVIEAVATKTPPLEMDGYTIIDGTPFPLDMFEDVEPKKTVSEDLKTEGSSTPVVSATTTDTMMASQVTISSQIHEEENKETASHQDGGSMTGMKESHQNGQQSHPLPDRNSAQTSQQHPEQAPQGHQHLHSEILQHQPHSQQEMPHHDQHQMQSQPQQHPPQGQQELSKEHLKEGKQELVKDSQQELPNEGQQEVQKQIQQDLAKDVQHDLAKDGQQELAKDGQQELAKDGQQELAKDGQQELAKDGQQELAKDGQQELAKDGQQELAKDGQHVLAKDGQQDLAKDLQQELAKDGQQELAKDGQQELAKNGQQELTKNGQQELAKELAKDGQQELAKNGQQTQQQQLPDIQQQPIQKQQQIQQPPQTEQQQSQAEPPLQQQSPHAQQQPPNGNFEMRKAKSPSFHPDVEDVTDEFIKESILNQQESHNSETHQQESDSKQQSNTMQHQTGIPQQQQPSGNQEQQQSNTMQHQTGIPKQQQPSGNQEQQQSNTIQHQTGIPPQQQPSGNQQQHISSTQQQQQETETPIQEQEANIQQQQEKDQQQGDIQAETAGQHNPDTPTENIKPIIDGEKTVHNHKRDFQWEEIRGTTSVSEQLMSSMNVDIPVKSEQQQATMVLQDNTDIKFGVANATDTTAPPNTEPLVHDVYRTADFLTRKPLSHNTGANVASVHTDEVQPDIRSPDQGISRESLESQETVTAQTVQDEIPPPPKQEEVTANPLGEESEHFLNRKINDDKLEEMEDKEFQDEQSWRIGMRSMESSLKLVVEKLPPSLQSLLEQEPLGLTPQMTVFVTIVTVAMLTLVTCITCLLGGKKKTKKTDPVVVLRGLEEKLFIATKERENLEDELEVSQKRVKELEQEVKLQTSSSGTKASEADKYKALASDYDSTISSQQKDIDKLNTELSQNKKDLQSKTNKLEEVQKQLKKKEQAIESVSEKLKNANKELDSVKVDLKAEKTQNTSLTKQIEQLETSKQQLLQEAEDWSEKVQDLTDRLGASEKGQTQIQEDLAYKENELEVLRDCFLQLKAFDNEDSEDQEDSRSIEEKLKAMMDVSVVNARLKTIEDERNLIQNRVDIEIQSRMDMEEQIAEFERKIEGLKTDKMKAERQSHDATTKLNVLTNYFKEKEAQLQRELGEQEAIKKQNINKLENADETTKMIKEELESYRLQTDDLKKEILSAERDFRSQIAANEKKAHDNWLSARAAERELKESRHECSVLRQKLTDLERRLMHGPSGLIRPLPTRGMPPPGMMNGPPPPGGDRPGSRGGPFPPPPPHGMRDDEMRGSPGPVRLPPPDRRGPRMPPPDVRSPPPFGRGPPPPMDRRSPPPYDRLRGPPGYRMPPPPDMLPPHLRGPPPPHGPSSPPPREPGSRHGAGTPRHRSQEHEPDHPPRQSSQV